MPAKKVTFASDLHLGFGRANDFLRTIQFYDLLDRVEAEGSELVLLGDFLELIQSDFLPIYFQHHGLFQRLFALTKKVPVTLVVGNHDAPLAVELESGHFFGSEIRLATSYENLDLKIYAEHGHAIDPFNAKKDLQNIFEAPNTGDRIAAAVGYLERKADRKIDDKLSRLELIALKIAKFFRRNLKQSFPPRSAAYTEAGGDFSEYQTYAAQLADQKSAEVVLLGHTHRPQVAQLENGKIYANTGSFVGAVGSEKTATFVEVTANSVELRDGESGAVLHSVTR